MSKCDCVPIKGTMDCMALVSGIPDPDCQLESVSPSVACKGTCGTGVALPAVSFLEAIEKPLGCGAVCPRPDENEPE